MRKSKFKVTFDTGRFLIITAWNFEEALILAKAKRIENGLSYIVKDWELIEK